MVLAHSSADKPAACSSYAGNALVDRLDPAVCSLRLREVPLMRETEVPAKQLREAGQGAGGMRDPADWFDMGLPNSFRLQRQPVAVPRGEQAWEASRHGRSAAGNVSDVRVFRGNHRLALFYDRSAPKARLWN